MASTRLYSWVDVEQLVRSRAGRGDWPEGLAEFGAWWDGVELDVAPEGKQLASDWLGAVFGPLFDPLKRTIRLETGERLPVSFASNGLGVGVRRPRLRATKITAALARPLPGPSQQLAGPPVAAFHSFKGGVGRTLHALATARALASTSPVLLVDGDLEAPGISWILSGRLPDPIIAYTDLLALVQGASNGDIDSVIELVAERLQNQALDGVFVLPSMRDGTPADVGISPADLVNADADPYRLTDVLSSLASRVGARAAIVDLRAGFSELSAGLLLDPRVHRVFVTSLSHQAMAGTVALLETVAADAPSAQDEEPLPAAVLSLVPDRVPYKDAVEWLSSSLAKFADQEDTNRILDAPIVVSPLRQEWLVLPGDWDEVMSVLDGEGPRALIEPLIDWLSVADTALAAPPSPEAVQLTRRQLEDVAQRLIYAETSLANGGETAFMPTMPLIRLASDHRTEVPTSVVVGAKGSGKTFTFLNLALASTWAGFAQAAGVDGVNLEATVVPALGPKNTDSDLESRLREARGKATETSTEVPTSLALNERVEAALQDPPSGAGGWRRFWLDLFMASVGNDGTVEDAETRITEVIASGKRLVFVVDGLEEAFLSFATDETQQAAIRALIQDVPGWLQLLETRPVGLVVFAREDIVRAVLPQNVGQLLQQHRAYALNWGDDEVLRLALWVAVRAHAIPEWSSGDVRMKPIADVEGALLVLWGHKMGSARSREARSTPWVLAALSDFRPQIQARDVVTFLHESAKRSVGESATDRILTPNAMRAALERCSEEKIKAIEEEDPRLGDVFVQLRGVSPELRRTPFRPSDIGLSAAALELLLGTGAAMRIDDVYWMPEIYRHGLGFQTAVARPRVIQLANRARR